MGSFALNYALEYNLNYEIYGEHVLCGISILHLPNKLSYAKGEVLDLDGGVIQLNYEDGLCDTIDMDQSMVSGFDNSKTGIQWLTVAHSGFMTTFSVSVKDKQLTRLTIKALPVKLQYLIDKEELDITGGVLTLYYDNDTTRDAYMIYNNGYKLMFADDFTLADLIVTGFDNADVGTKTIVVKYEGKIATFDVEVLDRTLIRLEITDMPTKTGYIKGDQLDLSGAKIKMYYDNDTIQTASVISVGGNHRMIIDGSSSSVPLAVDGFFSNNSGIQTIIISYNDCSASFVVKVRGENVIIGDPDGNGEVSVTDALYSMRAILGIIIIVDGDAVMAADIDDDGILTVSDALCILRLAAGLPIKYIVV
jgi:hypothetical protein